MTQEVKHESAPQPHRQRKTAPQPRRRGDKPTEEQMRKSPIRSGRNTGNGLLPPEERTRRQEQETRHQLVFDFIGTPPLPVYYIFCRPVFQ
jgi:hypothetical protein